MYVYFIDVFRLRMRKVKKMLRFSQFVSISKTSACDSYRCWFCISINFINLMGTDDDEILKVVLLLVVIIKASHPPPPPTHTHIFFLSKKFFFDPIRTLKNLMVILH